MEQKHDKKHENDPMETSLCCLKYAALMILFKCCLHFAAKILQFWLGLRLGPGMFLRKP